MVPGTLQQEGRMNPRLLAISGPLEGASFALTEAEISIGRDLTNQICLSEPAVSRRHSLIIREADQFLLRDLDSSNGTLVNGVPVRERQLAPGQQITIGNSLFLFLLDEEESAALPAHVHLDDGHLVTRTTLTLRRDEALYLQPERVRNALPESARLARDLNALLEVSAAINSLRSSAALQNRLLELILEIVPAEAGVIILTRDGSPDPASMVSLKRLPDDEGQMIVSRTVLDRVLRESVAVLSNDVAGSGEFKGVRSLVMARTQSLLAVPLAIHEQVFGVIYLDSGDPQTCFDENHLQLLTAIAGIAAVALENVRQYERLENETQRLQAEINRGHELIGESAPIQAVYQIITKVAPTDSTVLICGESGTGKELAARAIHQQSSRSGRPFVAINCAGLTETLLESDLFGHEKGAFTGAVSQKKGRFEVAEGGTVFLDEVGELPLPLQAKLLRVLQEREFERVGGTRTIKADIRVIAATNRDLEAAVRDSSFRLDLFYRLNVVALTMPPLRLRRDDIPLLAQYFIMKHSRKCKRLVRGLAPATRAMLMNHNWPGNIRELENMMERAVVLGSTELILPEDLPNVIAETVLPSGIPLPRYHEGQREAKKQLIRQALEQAEGKYSDAAELLGIHPNNLHRLIRNLGLKPLMKE